MSSSTVMMDVLVPWTCRNVPQYLVWGPYAPSEHRMSRPRCASLFSGVGRGAS